MRRVIILAGVFAGLVFLRASAIGQDAIAATNTPMVGANTNSAATSAAAVAEQQSIDEKFKQIAADIDSLRAADEALRDKVSLLHDEIQAVRTEQARLASNGMSAEDLKPLAAKIEEVDKKRIEDKDAITEQIKQSAIRLERLITDSTPPPPKPPSNPAPTNTATTAVDGYTYTVGPGDTLLAILGSYNAKFKDKGMKTITLKQLEEANSAINPDKLKKGQQIIIPRPPE